MGNLRKVRSSTGRQDGHRTSTCVSTGLGTQATGLGTQVTTTAFAEPENLVVGDVTSDDKLCKVPKYAHKVLQLATEFKGSDGVKYEVRGVVAYGFFGDVYRCDDLTHSRPVIVKTEIDNLKDEFQMLRAEVRFFNHIEKEYREKKGKEKKKNKFFAEMIGRGVVKDQFKYIAFKGIGPNLDAVRRYILKRNFTRGVALKICSMMLRAVCDVHSYGFLHRDVRPAQFHVGLGTDHHMIYLTDFSKTRRFKTEDGTIRPKKKKGPKTLYPTLKYLSRRAHKGDDVSRRDDIESWLFCALEVFDDAVLGWRKTKKRNEALRQKKDMFKSYKNLEWKHVPAQFKEVFAYVAEMGWEDGATYTTIEAILLKMIEINKITVTNATDWTENVKWSDVPPPVRPLVSKNPNPSTTTMQTAVTQTALKSKSRSEEGRRHSKNTVEDKDDNDPPSEEEHSGLGEKKEKKEEKKEVRKEKDRKRSKEVEKKEVINEDDMDDEEDFQAKAQGPVGKKFSKLELNSPMKKPSPSPDKKKVLPPVPPPPPPPQPQPAAGGGEKETSSEADYVNLDW